MSVGARAAAARRHMNPAKAGLAEQGRQARHVGGVAREQRGGGLALVDRVVGGQHRARGMAAVDLALEAGGLQFMQESIDGRRQGFVDWEPGNGHRGGRGEEFRAGFGVSFTIPSGPPPVNCRIDRRRPQTYLPRVDHEVYE
ncbi:hypothetical protein BGLA2_30078 [Burkholderia gladioli]|nr:hypothetical protein BGLA2_30078 [Burkholderia gladioli]